MKFGYFDDANKEYVITSPKTPLPWINYLGSENFFSLISNTCGGYSFYKDAKLLRLTRYRYNNVPFDSNGHYYYIKEGDTIWNPGWMPAKTDLDAYECHHGMGYSTFRSSKNDLQAELTAFVPVGKNYEINALTPDMILSVLPSPDQEHFLMENCEKLSAGLWYGIGSWDFTKRRQGLLGNIRNLIRTHKLERQLIHYHGKQESIS